MFVIEIFLPLSGNGGQRFAEGFYDMERSRLADRFGGLILHIEAKRQVLYPALIGTDLQDITREDAQILDLLDRLSEEAMTSPKWLVMFGELKHAVEHQSAQAESHLFDPSRRVLTMEQTSTFPAQMDAVKARVAEFRNLSVNHVADS